MPSDKVMFYSQEEAVQAIEGLTEADIIKLRQFARGAILIVSATRLTEDDLINESILRTLNGNRNWNCKLDILQHLIGAMKSIASDSTRSKSSSTEMLTSVDNELSAVSMFEAQSANQPLQTLEYERLLIKLSMIFESDRQAMAVVEDSSRGYKRSEIIQRNNLTEKEYGAIKKRITRRLIKEGI